MVWKKFGYARMGATYLQPKSIAGPTTCVVTTGMPVVHGHDGIPPAASRHRCNQPYSRRRQYGRTAVIGLNLTPQNNTANTAKTTYSYL